MGGGGGTVWEEESWTVEPLDATWMEPLVGFEGEAVGAELQAEGTNEESARNTSSAIFSIDELRTGAIGSPWGLEAGGGVGARGGERDPGSGTRGVH